MPTPASLTLVITQISAPYLPLDESQNTVSPIEVNIEGTQLIVRVIVEGNIHKLETITRVTHLCATTYRINGLPPYDVNHRRITVTDKAFIAVIQGILDRAAVESGSFVSSPDVPVASPSTAVH